MKKIITTIIYSFYTLLLQAQVKLENEVESILNSDKVKTSIEENILLDKCYANAVIVKLLKLDLNKDSSFLEVEEILRNENPDDQIKKIVSHCRDAGITSASIVREYLHDKMHYFATENYPTSNYLDRLDKRSKLRFPGPDLNDWDNYLASFSNHNELVANLKRLLTDDSAIFADYSYSTLVFKHILGQRQATTNSAIEFISEMISVNRACYYHILLDLPILNSNRHKNFEQSICQMLADRFTNDGNSDGDYLLMKFIDSIKQENSIMLCNKFNATNDRNPCLASFCLSKLCGFQNDAAVKFTAECAYLRNRGGSDEQKFSSAVANCLQNGINANDFFRKNLERYTGYFEQSYMILFSINDVTIARSILQNQYKNRSGSLLHGTLEYLAAHMNYKSNEANAIFMDAIETTNNNQAYNTVSAILASLRPCDNKEVLAKIKPCLLKCMGNLDYMQLETVSVPCLQLISKCESDEKQIYLLKSFLQENHPIYSKNYMNTHAAKLLYANALMACSSIHEDIPTISNVIAEALADGNLFSTKFAAIKTLQNFPKTSSIPASISVNFAHILNDKSEVFVNPQNIKSVFSGPTSPLKSYDRRNLQSLKLELLKIIAARNDLKTKFKDDIIRISLDSDVIKFTTGEDAVNFMRVNFKL